MSASATKTTPPKAPVATSRAAAPQNNASNISAFADNRPAAVAQRQMQAVMHQSPQVQRAATVQARIAQSPRQRAATGATPVQRKANKTGLPDELKAGVENLSGFSLDDVKVHYNSAKPAGLQAHAYAQGTDIHVAPGQEEHLPHEAWHVVQQKQGRVRPTAQLKGRVAVNDDAGLEREADAMGHRAAVNEATHSIAKETKINNPVVQRAIGFEFETGNPLFQADGKLGGVKNQAFASGKGWKAVPDAGAVEFVTEPADETQSGFENMMATVDDLVKSAMYIEKVLNEVQNSEDRERDGGIMNAVKSIFEKSHPDGQVGMAEHERTGPEKRPIAKVGYLAGGFNALSPDMWIMRSKNGLIEAAPQVTGAIKLEKIPAAINAVATNPRMRRVAEGAHDAETKELQISVGLAKAASLRFLEAHPKSGGLNERFVGMLALMISYLRVPVLVAEIENGPANYPKDMPILARTNFGAIALSAPETKEEWDFLKNPEALWAIAALDGSIDDCIFPMGYETMDGPKPGPTRKEFLDGLGLGKDIFAGSVDSGQASMGSMDMGGEAVDKDANAANDSAILEFRRLRAPIPVREWRETVDKVFRQIHAINK